MLRYVIGCAALVVLAWAVDRLSGRLAVRFLRPQPVPGFLVVAHRGASRYAPENTMAAFALAQQQGADAVECDVIFTRDGVPVVAHHHDMSERVPREQRPAFIGRMTLSQVQALDLGSWFSASFSSERVPTLAQALAFFRGRFRRIYLHDKHDADLAEPSPERLSVFARTIEDSGLVDRIHVMVNSSELGPWRAVSGRVQLIQSRNGPDGRKRRIPLAQSYADGMRQLVVYASARGLLQRGRLLAKLGLSNLGYLIGFWPDARIVADYVARGAAFNVFTIDDELRARLYIRAGFQAIGTNDPKFLVDLVSALPAAARSGPPDPAAEA